MAKLLYFAWVRQKIGKAEEEIALPAGVSDVNGLIAYLTGRGENYANAFASLQSIRCAVNQEHKGFDAAIADGDEIAFFPPVTGGRM
jgi:molybdopterin synthase sulfur carrier subunit